MKFIYTLLFTGISLASQGQFYFQGGYAAAIPQQEMAKNINPLHSLAVSGFYRLPGPLNRIMVGADMSLGAYAMTSKMQTFTFDNGATTRTRVNYSSNVAQGGLTGRIMILNDKVLMPYVSGKAGYAGFYSNIYIEDPHDPDGCRPLDRRTILKDGVFTTGYGGGLQLDWSAISKNTRKGRSWIDLSITQLRGGKLDYINTKKLIDPSHPPVGSDGKPLNVQFVNATTNQIHEHQVAEVYTTPLRMLELRLSAFLVL